MPCSGTFCVPLARFFSACGPCFALSTCNLFLFQCFWLLSRRCGCSEATSNKDAVTPLCNTICNVKSCSPRVDGGRRAGLSPWYLSAPSLIWFSAPGNWQRPLVTVVHCFLKLITNITLPDITRVVKGLSYPSPYVTPPLASGYADLHYYSTEA